MSRTFRDPIHKEIKLSSKDKVENLILHLIDCREMQRLRWIKQLGTGWLTYHGADASRFQHSLGAMHIARKIFKHITSDKRHIKKDEMEYHYAVVLGAALLHDIGHGPFSHTCEKFIHTRHEKFTIKIISDKNSEIYQTLSRFHENLAQDICLLLERQYPIKAFAAIVSSQTDCDRFDYLLRDSHFTGTNYGYFDLERVIASLHWNIQADCLTVVGQKGIHAVEDYLFARYSMYLQVYLHKKSLATDNLIAKLFSRVKFLMQAKKISYLENQMFNWLSQEIKCSLDDYIFIDDTCIIHHIKHWVNEKDLILKDLAKRFISRNTFKTYKVKNDAKIIAKTKSDKIDSLKKKGYNPEYYLDIIDMSNKPYKFYNPDTSSYDKAIFIQDDIDNNSILEEISISSQVIKALVNSTSDKVWMISI